MAAIIIAMILGFLSGYALARQGAARAEAEVRHLGMLIDNLVETVMRNRDRSPELEQVARAWERRGHAE
jgi:hypothetical protein